MADRPKISPELLDEFTKGLIARGKLVEAGWHGLSLILVDEFSSPEHRADMRLAFFAGAHHMFTAVMQALDDDDEPTEADLIRMDMIDKELREFETVLEAMAARWREKRGA